MILLVLPIQSLKATVECSNDKNPANFDEVQRFRTAFPFLSSFEEIFSIYSDDGIYIGEVNCDTKSGFIIKQGHTILIKLNFVQFFRDYLFLKISFNFFENSRIVPGLKS